MIFFTQLVYIKEGQSAAFFEFEEVAIPLIAKYGGELLLRVRPTPDTVIDGVIETPFEIHLVSFKTEDDFKRFSQDEERRRFLHLKEQAIETVILWKGTPV